MIVKLIMLVSTSNHMFGRAILDKLPKCIFENFEIAQVKRATSKFSKITRMIITWCIIISLVKHVLIRFDWIATLETKQRQASLDIL